MRLRRRARHAPPLRSWPRLQVPPPRLRPRHAPTACGGGDLKGSPFPAGGAAGAAVQRGASKISHSAKKTDGGRKSEKGQGKGKFSIGTGPNQVGDDLKKI